MFTNISFSNWRQFGRINIDFHKQLTVLTGPNGSGKTTIMNMIARHFDWNIQLIGTPFINNDTGEVNILPEIPEQESDFRNKEFQRDFEFGRINYEDGSYTTLRLPFYSHLLYNVIFDQINKNIKGINIPSYRPRYVYHKIHSVPTTLFTSKEAYAQYTGSRQNSYSGGQGGGAHETHYLKIVLLSLATFGAGNMHFQGNPIAIELYEGFQEILRIVLPETLGFKKISIVLPEIVLETETGNFPIDSVSGGITSIIDLAWQVFLFNVGYGESFVVCIDEPENHLHPQMQKDLLPNFMKAFPKIQFIVSTHSPFIISSVKDSNVYVLNYNIDKKIDSTLLNIADKSASANDILTNVLGLETTRPTWVEEVLDNIINKYLSIGITADNIDKFRQELKSIGFEKYLTSSVVELLDRNRHHD